YTQDARAFDASAPRDCEAKARRARTSARPSDGASSRRGIWSRWGSSEDRSNREKTSSGEESNGDRRHDDEQHEVPKGVLGRFHEESLGTGLCARVIGRDSE